MTWNSMQTKAAKVLNDRYATREARIERPPDPATVDSLGHPNGSWETFAAWTCGIESTGGDEPIVAGKQQGQVSHVLTGPYVAGVTPAMRVIDLASARTFAIKAAINVNGAGVQLALACIEKV